MEAHAHTAHGHGHEHNDLAHVASVKMLVGVFVALLVLTAVTVWLAKNFHFAGLEVWIAMIIATIKATLVGLYFMHLRYDKPFNTMVFLSSFLFVSIFIGFALMDTHQYKKDVVWDDKTPAATPAAPVDATPK
jgi:cytochrome c oxidase subunit 4